jgi:DNA polymerase-3 subunit epsilon
MAKYLFFDVETTGLPQSFNLPSTYVDYWPRIVSFAYILCDSQNEIIERGSFLIKPDGFTIPKSAEKIHGISTEKALELGIPFDQAISKLKRLLDLSEIIVGHNIEFDIKVLDSEFYRFDHSLPAKKLPYICTMKSSAAYCDLPDGKWPTLLELYNKLFGKDFDGVHNPSFDIKATFDCFWELIKLNIINPETDKFFVEEKEINLNKEAVNKCVEGLNNQEQAKLAAIAYFLSMLKQTRLTETIESQFLFLSAMSKPREEYVSKTQLTSYQQDFIDKEITDLFVKHNDIFPVTKSFEEKQLFLVAVDIVLHFLGKSLSNNVFRRDIIDQYYDIIPQYQEFSFNYMERTNDFSISTEDATTLKDICHTIKKYADSNNNKTLGQAALNVNEKAAAAYDDLKRLFGIIKDESNLYYTYSHIVLSIYGPLLSLLTLPEVGVIEGITDFDNLSKSIELLERIDNDLAKGKGFDSSRIIDLMKYRLPKPKKNGFFRNLFG